jgi:sugar/nucleoside kinase (ribokinase family)
MIVDILNEIDAYPQPQMVALIDHITKATGGPGLNMAVDLRRLALPGPVSVLGAVGDDENANLIEDECRRLGIDAHGLTRYPGRATSITETMVERGGRRTFFHHIGAGHEFDTSSFPIETSQVRILHAGSPGIHRLMDASRPDGGNGWTELLQRAQAAGIHTNMELISLNQTAICARPCLPYLDSIIINEVEAASVLGVPVPAAEIGDPDWSALEDLASGLMSAGVSTLAVVHFPAGCVAAAPGAQVWRQGSVRVPAEEVRSTTGAGDAFASGVIYGIHEGWDVTQCLRLGVATAAASVRSLSTSDGIEAAAANLTWADTLGHRDEG